MPDTKTVTRRNAAAKLPEHVAAPLEYDFHGVTMYGCPFCGTQRQDRDLAQGHIDQMHAGETTDELSAEGSDE